MKKKMASYLLKKEKSCMNLFFSAFGCLLFGISGLHAQTDSSRSLNDNQEKRQPILIIGTVHDRLNEPLINVSITNKTSGKSTLTDVKGAFRIEAVRGDSLSASYVGYLPYNWIISGEINFDITLDATSGSLNDVVITGYGQQQKKVSLVGAQSTVNAKELEQPVANLSTMLAGRISGVVGVQRSGLPGSNSADIWIRGIQTFGGNANGPLVIIDGVQGRSIDNFDPEDISSFTVLKDAAATAVYGSLGANGVILITTKRGREGRIDLMANYMEGITAFTKLPKMANGEDYMNLKNEAQAASGYKPDYSQDYIDSTLSPNANHYVYPDVDWLHAIFNKVSSNRRFNFSATGGSEKTKYYASLAYYDESSLMKEDGLANYDAGTKYQRYNFTSNVDMSWTKTTKFSLGITGYISNYNQPGAGATAAFLQAMSTNPVKYPLMYPGNLVAGVAEGPIPSANPWASITQTGYSNTFNSQISSTAQLSQDFSFWVKGLSANAQYSFDTYNQSIENRTRQRSVWYLNQAQHYKPDGSLNLDEVLSGSDNLGFSQSNNGNRQFTIQGQINYDRFFGNHHVQAMAVYNQLSQLYPFSGNFTDYIPHRQQNYAAKVSYSFKEKYFAEFNAGYNGSEDYAPSNRFGFFPSLGVGWILSKEKFFQPLSKIFQYFKIRYSDGLSGAPGTGLRFGYLTLITTGAIGQTFGTPANNTSYNGINISQYGADVQWAVSHTRDLGLEFNVLNDKLSFVLDYFRSHRTKVFLTRADFPDYAGLQYNPIGNYGIVDASGFDGTIELAPIQLSNKLSVSFRGTFTNNADRLIQDDQPVYANPYQERKGQNLLAQFGYIADGLFQSQQEIDNSPDQSALGHPRVGDIKYRDLNGDGVVNIYDQTKINRGNVPNWTFGFGFNINYGNFYLSAFFEGNQGAYITLNGIASSPFNNLDPDNGNVYAVATDRWTEENHAVHPFYPRLGYGSSANQNNSQASTWWVRNISFIRFKTLDFGYNFKNKAFLKHIGVTTAQLYFDGVNLMYWSPFKLWDPELGSSDGSVYPNTRNLAIGIRLNF